MKYIALISLVTITLSGCGSDVMESNDPIKCDSIPTEHLAVIFTLGQSNAANFGATKEDAGPNVYTSDGGQCFRAKDPMLGADGTQGSVWSRLGKKIIQSGLYDNVIFINRAVGGTSSFQWATGGPLNPRIADGAVEAAKSGLKVTHVFWEQGESDRQLETDEETYQNNLQSIIDTIRATGISAPIFISQTSVCQSGEYAPVRDAQRAILNPSANIFSGPDTDSLNQPEDRRDGCHFSEMGLDQEADLWLEAMRNK